MNSWWKFGSVKKSLLYHIRRIHYNFITPSVALSLLLTIAHNSSISELEFAYSSILPRCANFEHLPELMQKQDIYFVAASN